MPNIESYWQGAAKKSLAKKKPAGAWPKWEGMMGDTFEQWLPLRSLGVAQLPNYGGVPAVYALRDRATGDILKFGSTRCLRTRIFRHFIGGMGGGTTERIHGKLFENKMIDRVDVAWLQTKDIAEAERKERELRAAYVEANGRRPAWDLRD